MKEVETKGYKKKELRVLIIYIIIPLILLFIRYGDSIRKEISSLFTISKTDITFIGTFFKKLNNVIDKILLEVSRPLDQSSSIQKNIGLTTFNILKWFVIISIFLGAFKAEYLKQHKHNKKNIITKLTPHWSYHFFSDKPKTGNFVIISAFFYTLYAFYKYLYFNVYSLKLKDKLGKPIQIPYYISVLRSNLKFIVPYTLAFALVNLTYFYDLFHIKKKYFNYTYVGYVKTKKNKSNDDGEHLVRKTVKVPYTKAINMTLLALPILYIAFEILMFTKDNTEVNFNSKHFLFLVIFTLVVVYRRRIKKFYKEKISSSKHSTMLFKGPNYLTKLEKNEGLPINLGSYKSINQKFVSKEITNDILATPEYSISLWVWLDNFDNNSGDNFYSLLNYNECPHIKISSSQISIQVKNEELNDSDVIYTDRLKQQRWNNIVVTIKNNIAQIFINSKLVAYSDNIKLQNVFNNEMTLGESKFLINCAVKNITYYPKSLSSLEIKKQFLL